MSLVDLQQRYRISNAAVLIDISEAPIVEPTSAPTAQADVQHDKHYLKGKKIAANRPAERDPKVHGNIPGAPVGSTYDRYEDLAVAGVHATLNRGIHGNKFDGAFSIVMSGGYEDDDDHGETFTYTGEGGRDARRGNNEGESDWGTGKQVKDQVWESSGNNALRLSSITKSPVRVIRGRPWKKERRAPYAPLEGEPRYRYDGLYVVEDAWQAPGKTGFVTCRFSFRRLPNQPPLPPSIARISPESEQGPRSGNEVFTTPGAGSSTFTREQPPRQQLLSDLQVNVDVVYETEEEQDTNTISLPNHQMHDVDRSTPVSQALIDGPCSPRLPSEKTEEWPEEAQSKATSSQVDIHPARDYVNSEAPIIPYHHQSPIRASAAAEVVRIEPEPSLIPRPPVSSGLIQRGTKRPRDASDDSTASDGTSPPRKWVSFRDRLVRFRLIKEQALMNALQRDSPVQASTSSSLGSTAVDQVNSSSNISHTSPSEPTIALV